MKNKRNRILEICLTNTRNKSDVEIVTSKTYHRRLFESSIIREDTSRVYLKKPEVDVPRLGVIPKTKRGVYSSYGRVPIEVWLKKSY